MATKLPLKDLVEIAANPEPRCPCVLLLDTSASMEGERIAALNGGIQALRDDLAKDDISARRVEVAVVTFDSQVRVLQNFVTVKQFQPPVLTASGNTHMAGGIERALSLIDARKKVYRQTGLTYYRPWVFMITDGVPEGESDEAVERARQRLRSAEDGKSVAFFAVAVSGADTRRLSEIVVRTPLELEGLDFDSLFLWLSASMQSVSKSQPGDRVVLPAMSWTKRIAMFIKENEDEIKTGIRITKAVLGF